MSRLARESQQEFQRSGAEGKCIEARELIIALPEVYTQYEPQQVLEDFTHIANLEQKLKVFDKNSVYLPTRKIGKERKVLAEQIQQTEKEISERLDKLPDILREDGYPDVQAFMGTYREAVVEQYNRSLAEWERQVKEKRRPPKPPEREIVKNRLRQLQEQGRQQKPRKKSLFSCIIVRVLLPQTGQSITEHLCFPCFGSIPCFITIVDHHDIVHLFSSVFHSATVRPRFQKRLPRRIPIDWLHSFQQPYLHSCHIGPLEQCRINGNKAPPICFSFLLWQTHMQLSY